MITVLAGLASAALGVVMLMHSDGEPRRVTGVITENGKLYVTEKLSSNPDIGLREREESPHVHILSADIRTSERIEGSLRRGDRVELLVDPNGGAGLKLTVEGKVVFEHDPGLPWFA
ncbi:MAG TPA: hypothetical protein VLB44_14590, partial [Kofleriaceae bacterium]|nr:hypothetical protein [Kofleriaceae bacterium]